MDMIRTRKLATGLLAGAAGLALVVGTGLAQTGTGTTGGSGTQQGTTGTMGQSGTGQTGADTVAMLDKEEIRSMLEEQGYSDVQNLKEEGAAWTAKATRDGEEVELRIERMWQAMATGQNLDEARLKTMLETEGYSSIGDIEQDGQMWSAEAERNGESVKVHVNAERQVVVSERTSG